MGFKDPETFVFKTRKGLDETVVETDLRQKRRTAVDA
jgi:hypothetical protein